MKRWLAVLLLAAAPSWAAVFSGTITKISTRTFTVTEGDEKKTFRWDSSTQVEVDGEETAPERLRVGQRVTVQYTVRDQAAVAQKVRAEPPRDRERKENLP